MQKYLVFYQANAEWKKTFAKSANDAVKNAEEKDAKVKVTCVWAADWRTPTAIPFCLRGDGTHGREKVYDELLKIRAANKILADGKKSLRGKAYSNWPAANYQPKEQPKKVKNLYKRPYKVLVAVSSTRKKPLLSLTHQKASSK